MLEKFEKLILSNHSNHIDDDDGCLLTAKDCVFIAEEEMINFGMWVSISNYVYISGNLWGNYGYEEKKTTEDLIREYKRGKK